MISWLINGLFLYVPLNINCLSEQGPVYSLSHISLTSRLIADMLEMCSKDVSLPIVFDFAGFNIVSSKGLATFSNKTFKRPVLFQNLSEVNISRLRDDGVDLHQDPSDISGERNDRYWIGLKNVPGLVSEIDKLERNYYHFYIKAQSDALSECNEVLSSTPVYATKYYDVRKLCVRENSLKIIATGLATKVLERDIDFDFVVSSSHTGSFIAVPVSLLVSKPLHCWTDFGPIFSPKLKLDWVAGKGKKCLLVADVICMGTEVRATQAFMAASGSRLVACAAVATYLAPTDLPCVTLLDRHDLEEMGYKLSIPK